MEENMELDGKEWLEIEKWAMSYVAPTNLSQKLNKILAKRECLGCPPNGDATRANEEPDRRCKDTKAEGKNNKRNF